MLRKSNRLTKKQFDDYFAVGKRFHFPYCTIIYHPHNTNLGAVVVGKKVSKRAVVRNRLRRRAYAILRQQMKSSVMTGVFIILIKPTLTTLPRKVAALEIKANIAEVQKKD